MSIKTTQHITRQQALDILLDDLPKLPNDALGQLMDALADTERSHRVSRFDNFIVSDFVGDSQ
jgi:putative heme degradation protein